MSLFDKHRTGANNPVSALYYCMTCGEIIPLSKNETFPPCTPHGSAEWLCVAIAGEAGPTHGIGGDCPHSGLYLCRNCYAEVIPLAKDDNFPPHRTCDADTKWQLIIRA